MTLRGWRTYNLIIEKGVRRQSGSLPLTPFLTPFLSSEEQSGESLSERQGVGNGTMLDSRERVKGNGIEGGE